MKENFDKIAEVDQENLMVNKVVEDFNKIEIPLKIRKIKLLETMELPISKIDFIKKEDADSLESMILKKFEYQDYPLIIRFACIPDKFSMPSFYIEKEMDGEEKRAIIEKINSLTKDDMSIKYLIIQDATPVESAKDKISGRISFEKEELMPVQEILEIYKGARSTGILNNVDINDPNFQRFTKKAGEFMKPTKKLDTDSLIKESEVREIYSFLNIYQEKIETITDIIAKSQNNK
ncbi:MAG: hypothetical protein AAB394_02985 [Patescibacteria group bacterium]